MMSRYKQNMIMPSDSTCVVVIGLLCFQLPEVEERNQAHVIAPGLYWSRTWVAYDAHTLAFSGLVRSCVLEFGEPDNHPRRQTVDTQQMTHAASRHAHSGSQALTQLLVCWEWHTSVKEGQDVHKMRQDWCPQEVHVLKQLLIILTGSYALYTGCS